MIPLLLVALLLGSIILLQWSHYKHKQQRLGASQASTVSLKDMVKTFVGADREDWRMMGSLFRKYGWTFQLYSGIRTWTFTSDPENIKAMLSSQVQEYNLGRRPTQFSPIIGNQGVFTAEGKAWQHCRTLLKPQFSRENISHLHMLETHIPVLTAIIRRQNGKPMDIQEILFRYTITTALDFLVGTNIRSLEAFLEDPTLSVFGDSDVDWHKNVPVESDEGRNRFIQAFEHSQKDLFRRAIYYDTYWMLSAPHAKEARAEIHKHIDHFINEALQADEEKIRKITAGQKGYVFLYQLVKESRDPMFLRDQILSILVAARDTTTALLTWTFFYLARYPDVFEKMKKEIRDKFGPGTEDDVAAISFDDLRECTYIRQILNETLRVSAVVPVNYRAAVKDTTLPRGGGPNGDQPILIEKGQTVYFNNYFLHRRKDIWGEDAEEWKPDRWADMKLKPWCFVPFGGGPRVCAGQAFSLTEATYVLVRLFQQFDHLECIPGQENDSHDIIEFKKMAALFMQGGCNVKIY